MKQKLFFLLVALSFLLPVPLLAYDFESGGIYYDLNYEGNDNDGNPVYTARVASSPEDNKYSGDIVIPSTIEYKGQILSVTSIEQPAFQECSSLASVVIPNSVTYIEGQAFYGCTSLTSVEIPNSVTSIRGGAFQGCTSLASVVIPNSVTSIEGSTFSGCSSLVSVEIPNSVTSIGGQAFFGCTSLASVEIPNSVTSIEESAFQGCSSLASVVIPNSVTSIRNYAFWNCTSLASVEIPNSVTSIEESAFQGCSSLASVEIPNSVTSIEPWTFYGCSSLASVVIPNSVTSIEESAFQGCSSLASVEIPNSVTSIGGAAFQGCSSLVSVEIPNSVTSIGGAAFNGCTSLTSVEIPNSVTSIGDNAFSGCFSLTSVEIPNSVTSIGDYAFRDCSMLRLVLIWGENITFANQPFGWHSHYVLAPEGLDCTALSDCYSDCYIRRFNPATTTRLDDWTILTDDGKTLLFVPHWHGADYAIPEGVTKIMAESLDVLGESTYNSLTIPSTIQEIEPDVFLNTKIEKVNFTDWTSWYSNVKLGNLYSNPYWNSTPYVGGVQMVTPELIPGMTEIPDYINCGLQFKNEIEIPGSVTRIGAYAFYNNKELYSVILPAGLKEIGESAFEGCTLLENPSFPSGLKKIEDGAYKGCTAITEITLPEGLTMLGTNTSGTEVVDENATKGVFEGCTALEKAVVAVNVDYLADNIFKDCQNLDKIYFPLNLRTIGNSAFEECNTLDEIIFPATLESIGEKAFKGGDRLPFSDGSISKLVIPDGVSNIGKEAFAYQNITNLSIGSGVETIPERAFYRNYSLKVINFSEGLKEIGEDAFSNTEYIRSNIGSVLLPSTVTSIGVNAFLNSYISSLVIPDGVESLGPGSCGFPSSLTIGSGIKDIASDAFNFEKLYTIRLQAHMPPSLSDAFPITSEQNDQLTLIVNKDRHDTYNTNARWKQIDRILEEGESEVEIYLDGTYSLAEEIRMQSGYMPSVVTKMMVDGPLTPTDLRVIKENMVALRSLDLSHVTNLTALPEHQFDGSLLTTVILPPTLDSIADYAFNSCRLLELTELPTSVRTIGANAFSSCPKVNLNALPASLARIGDNAFSESGMIEVTTGETLTDIGYGAFQGCKLLERADLAAAGLTEIASSAFSGCGELDEVILPPTVEAIGSSAFSGTAIRNVDFAAGVKEIGDGAFSNNRRLVSATLPGSLTRVGSYLFADCPRLISLSMPGNVASIGTKIVSNDRRLASLSCSATETPEAETGAFDDVRFRYLTLTIPTLNFRDYLNAPQWGKFENMKNSIKVSMDRGIAVTSTAENEYQDMLAEDALEAAQEAAATQGGKMSPARAMRRAAARAATTRNFATVFDGAQMSSSQGAANRIFITPDPEVNIISILFEGEELLQAFDGQSVLLPEGKSGTLEILTDAPDLPDLIMGDADGNGVVDANDVVVISNYYLGVIDTIDFEVSDLNGDGEIDAQDALATLNIYLQTTVK